VLWAFALFLSIVLWVVGYLVDLPAPLQVLRIWPPAFTGMILAMVCLLQFTASVLIDRRYENDLPRALFWVIWYPFVYWLINLLTTLYSFPKVMIVGRRKRARWKSPDRGIKELT
ncbi:MAG TPA: poly-beta-1,6 N-acetyl-D-glucosamine synthase, partial [Burkholderiaceae bacterium]|nr:poly-beta-1,6 N-acetyl-D-glucosamine synthase [Burkholderiaceae bacterium]